MAKEVIVALDFKNREETLRFLDRFEREKPYVKIGMELFYKEGRDMVLEIKKRGHKIFLDLKLHDIPNTVEKAMRSLSSLDVDMINLHAAGGRKMMEAALRGLTGEAGKRPLLIGVTQLTSTDDDMLKNQLLIEKTMGETVLSYGENVKASGLDGIVCSPLESPSVHENIGGDFLTVTPGIRFAEDGADDQVRVTDPAGAGKLGSDYIVMGRSITGADDPVKAYKRAMREFGGER